MTCWNVLGDTDRNDVDPTYNATWEGWAYLATVIDLASRRVVGWALADHMRTDLVADALRMACVHRRPARRGDSSIPIEPSQYTSGEFAELAAALGVTLSLGRKGQCWDNAVSESWFSSFKNELIDTRPWPTIAGLHRAVFNYIEGWYNVRPSATRAPPPTKLPSTTTPSARRHSHINTTNPSGESGQAQSDLRPLSERRDSRRPTAGSALHVACICVSHRSSTPVRADGDR